MSFLYVFIGGGLGSLARYAIARWMSAYHFQFPWATFTANLLACILLGILIALNLRENYLPSFIKPLVLTGFCGGFSTFSTFTAETVLLFENGNHIMAFSNVLLSLVVCAVGFYVGYKIVG